MVQGSKDKKGVGKRTSPLTQALGYSASNDEARLCDQSSPLLDLSEVAYDLGYPSPLAVTQKAYDWWVDGSDVQADRVRSARRLVVDLMKASEVAQYRTRDRRRVILLALLPGEGRGPCWVDFKLVLGATDRDRLPGRMLLLACECEHQLGATRSAVNP